MIAVEAGEVYSRLIFQIKVGVAKGRPQPMSFKAYHVLVPRLQLQTLNPCGRRLLYWPKIAV
jgi:hypothetical protein